MKKFDWNAPMTRKDWAVVYAIAVGASFLMWIIATAWIWWDNLKDWIGTKIKKLKEKFS